MQTLTSRIEAVADLGGTVTFKNGDDSQVLSWAELHDDARAMAAALQARGIEPGMHVGLLGPTTRPLVTGISATWLAGATLMMLPLPMRLASIEDFVAQTRMRLRQGDVDLLIGAIDNLSDHRFQAMTAELEGHRVDVIGYIVTSQPDKGLACEVREIGGA